MAVNTLRFVQPTQADTTNDYSDSIWGTCPLESLRDGAVPGDLLEYDFDGFKLSSNVNAAEATWADRFNVFGSNGAIIGDDAAVGGSVNIGSDGDNEGASILQANQTWQISQSTFSFWLEARIQTSTIADTKHNIFCGLIDGTAATAISPITALGALADVNMVGFFRPETARSVAGTGGAIMNTVYKADGVTAVNVQTDACALVAATFTKLGMYYRPAVNPFNLNAASTTSAAVTNDGYGKYLFSFYQDGRILSTQKQVPSANGTDFPNDVKMRFCLAVLNATGTTPGTTSIDRVRIAQTYGPSLQ
jgi:hypothetical protein